MPSYLSDYMIKPGELGTLNQWQSSRREDNFSISDGQALNVPFHFAISVHGTEKLEDGFV